jgi:hypothetical protein
MFGCSQCRRMLVLPKGRTPTIGRLDAGKWTCERHPYSAPNTAAAAVDAGVWTPAPSKTFAFPRPA